jgi:hypothetical protein
VSFKHAILGAILFGCIMAGLALDAYNLCHQVREAAALSRVTLTNGTEAVCIDATGNYVCSIKGIKP